MRTIRYYFRFLVAFVVRFRRIIAVSVVLGVFIFLFSSQLEQVATLFGQGEVTGTVGRLSPDDLPGNIQEQISVGLTAIDEHSTVKPGLAISWIPEDEGKTWIFQLGDFVWQDGSPVAASDINYRFTDVRKEIINEKTLKFTLKDPFAPFPSVVSKPVFKKGLLGAGEWQVAKFSSLGSQLTHSIGLVNKKTGHKRTYRFYQTEEAVRTAYKLGHVKRLEEIVDPGDLLHWKNSVAQEHDRVDRYVGIFINTQDKILSSKNARQALAYAINKDKFEQKRAISPISPNSWAFNPQVKQYTFNPTRSKELIKTLDQQQDLTVNLVTSPSLLSIADKIKADWEAVGIKTNIQVLNAPPTNFQTFLAIQAIPPDPDQYSLWHSTQTLTNITGYNKDQKESQRIDKLLEDGRKTLDIEERKKIYFDFQRFLLEDLPVIPLFHPVTYTITRK